MKITLRAGLIVAVAALGLMAFSSSAQAQGFRLSVHGRGYGFDYQRGFGGFHGHGGYHRSGPVYHPPSVHYDRYYHHDYYHWTPRRGWHSHGHYHVVPHYVPGHFDYRHGNHLHLNPRFHRH